MKGATIKKITSSIKIHSHVSGRLRKDVR